MLSYYHMKVIKLKQKILVGVLVVIVVIVSLIIGMAAAGYFTKPIAVANGIVVSSKNNEGKLLTSYEEYTKLMEEYNTSDFVVLTNNSFESNDYIVDFIKYNDDLEIYNISLEVNDDGIKVIYDVNKEVKKSNKYLMYFIPVEKGLLSDVKVKEQVFNEK